MTDDTPAIRRLAFVLEATPHRVYFPLRGWVWRFPSSDRGAGRTRAEAGWTSLRIDRATRDRLEELRKQLPKYLTDLQGDMLTSSRQSEHELSVVELIAALSTAAVKLLEAPAPAVKKSRLPVHASKARSKVHASKNGSSSKRRKQA